ncbi:MAG TPA: hypothetical protein VK939_01280 [Longimicrobiales bacterium]|nr:hypothetical protein [Longimicrobiales bacterium]
MPQSMSVADAQREVRSVFLSGSVGQAVSGSIWLISALAASIAGVRAAVLILVAGGAFIFPLTQLVLRLLGRRASLAATNPLNALAMQVAFIVPLMLPVAGAAALYRTDWFYPAVMVVVGAHYLPFIFLYGMRAFGVLAGVLLGGGVLLALRGRGEFADGAWFTAVALLAFAAWAALAHRREPAHVGHAMVPSREEVP